MPATSRSDRAPIGDPLLVVTGTGEQRLTGWRALAVELPSAAAGGRVSIQLEARDAGGDAVVEAGVDTVRVTVG